MLRERAEEHGPDYTLVALIVVVVILGLVFLTSASSVLGLQKFKDSYYYLKHQVWFGLVPGVTLFLFFSKFSYQKLRAWAAPALFVTLGLLALVFIPGVGLNFGGAHRWVSMLGISFQPSEIAKLTYLIYLASWLESREQKLSTMKHGLVPFLVVTIAVLGLVLIEPDLGTMSVIAVSVFAVYLVAGAPLTHLLGLLGVGAAAVVAAIKLAPYRAARLTVFLNPELDPQGIGYHINQALLAIGSGGWWGVGLGYSRQKYQYLPEVTGDSIFAVIAEEIGFIFTVGFLLLLGALLLRGFRVARYAPDSFGRFLGTGIVTWLGWQMCLNIGSMVNILPLTGVPLPLVSYGGTALMVALAGLGILTNISRQGRNV